MAAKNEPVIELMDRDFVVTRMFDAPRELVFKAWTDPRHMTQWWGPHHFTNSVCQLDVRPGGAWRIVMLGSDGAEHPAKGVYREVVPPERLVMTIDHSELSDQWHDKVNPSRDKSKGKPAIEALTTVTFEDIGGKTKLTIRIRFESVAVRDSLVKIGMSQGWSQSLERLEQELMASTADREIVATRLFDAPRDLVFKMWTEPEDIAKWWGPNGFTNTIHEMDVKPGGVWRFIMHGPDGRDYPNKIVYVEVVKPQRIVYDHVSAPRFQVTVIFSEQGDKTRMDFRMLFESAELRNKTVEKFGAVEGLNQTLARLAEQLAKI